MVFYDEEQVELLEFYLYHFYENFREPHFVLLSWKGDGKAPIKEWKNYRPSKEEVLNHIKQKRRIGVVPRSIGQFVVDVDHGGASSWKNISKYFPIEDPKGHCLHSGTKGKYHIWLPISKDHELKKKPFILDGNCSGDLIYDHYIVLHKPTEMYLESVSERDKVYYFDKEITEFKNKFVKGAKKPTERIPEAEPIYGLSQWKAGGRHDPMIAAFKLITNPRHFKNHEDVTTHLSKEEISFIIQNELVGSDICKHALACGHSSREVKDAYDAHKIEVQRHVKVATKTINPLKSKLSNMSLVGCFEYMLNECGITLKWDVSRELWEIDFKEGEGLQPYIPDNSDENYKYLKSIFRDKFPCLGKQEDHKGFSLSELIWSEVHSGYKRRKHNQKDERSDYLLGDQNMTSLIEAYEQGERLEEIEVYKEEARSYLRKSLGIEDAKDVAYARTLSEFFFKEYALCLMNIRHRAKLIIVLIGKRDVGKSSYVRTLIPREWHGEGRKFFTEVATDKSGGDWMKETGIATKGCVGVELPEIKLGLNTPLKSLIGSDSVVFRDLYQSNVTTRRRNFWTMGTANYGQVNLSATDQDWVEKFAFLNVKKFIKDSQDYANDHLKDAIIGGYFCYLDNKMLTHPFIGKEGAVSYKMWKQMTDREVGTHKERQYADDIREMMLASCGGQFSPAVFGKPPLSVKMKLLDIVEAVEAHKLWKESGYNTEAPERYHKVYSIKPNKDARLISSALSIVGWRRIRTKTCNLWKLEDVSGFWAKKGFAELGSESQQEQEE